MSDLAGLYQQTAGNPDWEYSIGYAQTGRNADNATYHVTISARMTNSGAYFGYGIAITTTINGSGYAQTIKNASPTWSGNDWQGTWAWDITASAGSAGGTLGASISIRGQGGATSPNMDISRTVNLSTYAVAPTKPTSCTAPTDYHYGDTYSITWSGATGTITGYDLDYEIKNKDTGVYGGWSNIFSNSNQTSFSAQMLELCGTIYQFRVRACNGSLKSDYTYSNEMTYRVTININLNGTYKKGTPFVKINGTWARAKKLFIKSGNTWNESK